ncbi:unnamed protein product [Polarella glacialis]|uniref:PAS domain-containing protein n=1 Tax=Polarella glacialis TaxID=89957 RepID=A0A813LJZ8_POLGL|nr:unnamed protein product [Polarella glacialis]
MVLDRIYVFIGRLIATIVFGSFRSSLLLNTAYAITACSMWASFAMQDPNMESQFGYSPVLWFTIQETVSLVVLSSCCLMHQNRTQSEAQATIEARASRAFQSAIQMLLRTIYDVVIQLDQDLKLVGNAEALGGLLLHGCNRSLKGASLLDYMYGEEDKELFQAHINQMPADELQTMAIPLRLRMRDSSGRPLYVELLHSTFKDIDAQTHHIIGIQEIEQNKTAFEEILQVDKTHSGNSPTEEHKRHPHLELGTPPNGIREELSGSLSDFSPTPSILRPALPELQITHPEMLSHSLFVLLLRWNLQVPSTFCCNFHFYVYQVQGILRRMQKLKCADTLLQLVFYLFVA